MTMKKASQFFIIHVFILISHQSNVATRNCFPGTYVHTSASENRNNCELCPKDTFMPLKDHAYRSCFNCTKMENVRLEILVKPCTRTEDTVIECIDGYYRQLPRNPREQGQCVKCTECRYPILPCRPYSDTHCCNGENYDVVANRDGVPVCWEKPWLCRKGHYFHEPSFECRPCPDNSFMPLDFHTMTECIKCPRSQTYYLPKHVVIIEECNSTHPARLGCESGYRIDHNKGHWGKDIGCSLCKTCSAADGRFEGRECNHNHDTVCCPRPNMTVVDAPGGPECIDRSSAFQSASTTSSPDTKPVCCEEQHPHTDPSSTKTACKPCTNGTNMDQQSHTNSASECNCADFKGQLSPLTYSSNGTDIVVKENVGLIVGSVIASLVTGALFGIFIFILVNRYHFTSRCCGRPFETPNQSEKIDKSDPGEDAPCLNEKAP